MLNNMVWGSEVSDILGFEEGYVTVQSLDFYQEFARLNHPDLKMLRVQGEQLTLDRRFYAEQVRPELNLNYNFLLENMNNTPSFSANNYKAGISFSIPIFLRKERSKLQMARLKISENEQKYLQKEREILNKVEAAYNDVTITTQLVSNQEEVVANYERMLEGERIKFQNGESSIFLINSRQNKLLEAQLKLIDLQMMLGNYIGKLFWQSGYFPESFNP